MSEVLGFANGLFYYLLICSLIFAVLWAIAILPTRIFFRNRGRADRVKLAPDRSATARVVLTLATLAAATFAYMQLRSHELNHSALMFIGLPALLSLGLTMVRFDSPYATVAKGITIFLALSYLLLGEGLVCVLMAAPAFYAVGFVLVPVARDAYQSGRRMRLSLLATLVLLISLEGAHPSLSFNREHSATASGQVELPATQVAANLAGNPNFAVLKLSPLLKLGFPVPVHATGTGLNPGDRRQFTFQRGDIFERVSFVVVAGEQSELGGYVELSPQSDQTKIDDWLSWRGTRIEWQATDRDQTDVQVTMRYRRELDPAWYFAPMQKGVVWLAAKTMIEHARTTPLSTAKFVAATHQKSVVNHDS